MGRLLHIIATPRGNESRTLVVAGALLDEFRKQHPDYTIEEINLFSEKLPSLTIKQINGKYALLAGKELTDEQKSAWQDIVEEITRFLSADAYVVSTPMWNFGIPYVLKHYIDIIVQPKYLFHYTQNGPEGLVKNKKMAVITSRGGDYSNESPFHGYDLQEPYLRTVFGFVGITDITFVNAQPMDAGGPQTRDKKLNDAKLQAKQIAQGLV